MLELNRRKLVDAALGRVPCDLLIRGVRYLDVHTLKWNCGDVAIHAGHIVGCGTGIGLHAERIIEGKSRSLVPGFIDAHVHIESSLMTPSAFARAVVARGTTTAVCDPHEVANVVGVAGIRAMLESAQKSPVSLRVMLPSCVPATGPSAELETNGGGEIAAADLLALARDPRYRPHVQGLAEMMNVPGVLGLAPDV